MSEEHIKRYTRDNVPNGKTDWARVDALTDEEIEEAVKNDPDAAPIADEEFWKRAVWVRPEEMREFMQKRAVSIRIDGDVLEWFKRQGKGYQTRINQAPREYMKAHSR